MVRFLGEETQHASLACEAEDVVIVTEEEGLVIDVAAESEAGAGRKNDFNGVDADTCPEGVFIVIELPVVVSE